VRIPSILRALRTVAHGLPHDGYDWAVTGSAALLLRGCPINARDVDVIASREVSLVAARVLRDYCVHAPRYCEAGNIRSLFARYSVQGWTVEIMADVENRLPKRGWVRHDHWQPAVQWVSCFGIQLPFLRLGYELGLSRLLGNRPRTHILLHLLNDPGPRIPPLKAEQADALKPLSSPSVPVFRVFRALDSLPALVPGGGR
jgi:hypothetical protein